MADCKYLRAAIELVSIALDQYGVYLEELSELPKGRIPKPNYVEACAEYYDPKVTIEDQFTNASQLADLVWLAYHIGQDINELIFRINAMRNPESAVNRIAQGLYGIVPEHRVKKVVSEMHKAPQGKW